MWTPKRLLLLVLGFVGFLTTYFAYANRIGGIDGLPPLPKQYYPKDNPEIAPPPKKGLSLTARRLEQAFGKGCEEASLKRPIKIEVPARGMILSAGDFRIMEMPDGRVELKPVSVALFGKAIGEDGTPEINTIRGNIAYLTFDHPIQYPQDIGRYHITDAQIAGDVSLVNNRRTAGRDDDISVFLRNGPLFYRQKDQRIWTDDVVYLRDDSSKPRPTEIRGHGMILDLLSEAPAAARTSRPRKQQVDNITGVRRVRLLSMVDMHLYVDAGSGFLSSDKPPPRATAAKPGEKKPAAAAEKSHLHIVTPGEFSYDMQKEFARFDIPEGYRQHPASLPEQVLVDRGDDKTTLYDHLICEHLELQFRKKVEGGKEGRSAEGPRARPAAGTDHSGLEIETAVATGSHVLLTSDVEKLDAEGTKFTYDARTLLSILQGGPMTATKEDNHIAARELRIKRFKDRKGQEATALGSGRLDLYDKKSHKFTQHARWTEKLISSKDGDFDVLHLIGDASFVDEDNGQELRADDLKVWLKPREAKEAPKKPAPGTAPKPATAEEESRPARPHHVVAEGHVIAHSAEFNIPDARRFVVWFKDASPEAVAAAAAATAAAAKPAAGAGPTAPGTTPPVRVPSPPGAALAGQRPAPQAAGPVTIQKPGTEPHKPINLWARSVEAHVLRFGERSQLEELRSEGTVHVTQDPADPKEKGIDIKGETLHMTVQPEGNLLTVTGDLALLDMGKLVLKGPTVNIDQATNRAWVDGIGAMIMESDTDMEGKKLKKAVPLTIYWNKSMYFNGTFAEFHGSIQAEQENARLACQALEVFFDKPISLKERGQGGKKKEGEADSEKAHIHHLVADKSARTEDVTYEDGKPVKVQGMKAPAISFDNEAGIVQGVGPGAVRIIQKGSSLSADPAAPAPGGARPGARPARPGEAKDDDGLKLTYVEYADHMSADKKTNVAYFYGSVRVYYKPVEDFETARSEEIDLVVLFKKKLPEGAMFLRCNKLEVRSRPQEKAKATQEMIASGPAQVISQDFSGSAPQIKFDEFKDQVIFDGLETGTATLIKAGKAPGQQATRIDAQKIIYNRKTGGHTAIRVKSIEGNQ